MERSTNMNACINCKYAKNNVIVRHRKWNAYKNKWYYIFIKFFLLVPRTNDFISEEFTICEHSKSMRSTVDSYSGKTHEYYILAGTMRHMSHECKSDGELYEEYIQEYKA
jgi:hypothetical protein